MKDLIVNSLELICQIGFGLLLVGGLIPGLIASSLLVMLAGLLAAFVAGTLIFGVLFLLIDINANMRAVRNLLEKRENS